jgi:uncharacterized protein YoxC
MSGWVEAFIVIAAIAIVMQMTILLVMMLQLKKSLEHFTRLSTDLQARIDPILTRVNRILEDSEGRISSVMGDTAEITPSRAVRPRNSTGFSPTPSSACKFR